MSRKVNSIESTLDEILTLFFSATVQRGNCIKIPKETLGTYKRGYYKKEELKAETVTDRMLISFPNIRGENINCNSQIECRLSDRGDGVYYSTKTTPHNFDSTFKEFLSKNRHRFKIIQETDYPELLVKAMDTIVPKNLRITGNTYHMKYLDDEGSSLARDITIMSNNTVKISEYQRVDTSYKISPSELKDLRKILRIEPKEVSNVINKQ